MQGIRRIGSPIILVPAEPGRRWIRGGSTIGRRGNSNTNNPGYRQYLRLGDIPLPATIFTFIDEHPDSINDGYFLNRLARSEWVDLPGSNHGGAASVSFADGHAESRRWRSALTVQPARPDAVPSPLAIPVQGRMDHAWLMERTTATAPDLIATPY